MKFGGHPRRVKLKTPENFNDLGQQRQCCGYAYDPIQQIADWNAPACRIGALAALEHGIYRASEIRSKDQRQGANGAYEVRVCKRHDQEHDRHA